MTLQEDNYKFTDRDHKELYLLYENSAMNLEALKKRTWQAYVSYSAAMAFLVLIYKNDAIHMSSFVRVLIIFVLFIGVILVP
ncbi:MAG TPA: hypothetical protein VI728_12200 [Syntrophales bacterium]|nr:hypothetical protein [Syntrophales bacterium]